MAPKERVPLEEGQEANSVVAKLAGILDAFGEAPHQYTFTEVAERTGVSKASVHRLMLQLVDIGFLEKTSSGKTYKLGQRLTRLLHFNVDGAFLETIFGPVLTSVADSVSEAAFAARLTGMEVELFAVRGPSGRNKSFIHPGLGVRPAHACSSAKCILAHQSELLLRRLLDSNLPRFTVATTVEKDEIVAELETVRRVGFAVCDEEIDSGVYSIAYPVFLKGTGVIYSIGVVAPKSRMSEDRIQSIREHLRYASARISKSRTGLALEVASPPALSREA
ncbi:MAG: IclR family transcriptional regulator [Rhodospirillales bacterium]